VNLCPICEHGDGKLRVCEACRKLLMAELTPRLINRIRYKKDRGITKSMDKRSGWQGKNPEGGELGRTSSWRVEA
jgi:hypothetical protein